MSPLAERVMYDEKFQSACQRYAHANGSSGAIAAAAVHAAAPDMLAALEGAIRSLEWWQRNEPGSFGNTEAARLEIARTVVSQATGGK